MRRLFTCIILFIMCVCYASAQTQQGIVKTRGRMDNGQLVAGTRLSGATITLNFGNSLVSGSQGEFSFNVPSGKTYSLVMAEKKGYTLADPEYTRRSFSYSASNPFYVVLEDVNQRQADINAATRKVRRTLTAQLQKREEEIEALKEQNKLSEEEYQKRLQELYDNQSKSEQLVKDMAERYASTDYDQLDEFNRQVQMYIEEGELQKADSMIRSKGDMEKRVEEYHNAVKANKQERQELDRREAQLVKSEAGAVKTYEDLSQDLLRKSEIFFQEFKQDSALHYLKMRADLDTTNVVAVGLYAEMCFKQKKFSDCKRYYHMCLSRSVQMHNILVIAIIQTDLGNLYCSLHDYPNSEKYHKSALENLEKLFQQNPNTYRPYIAGTQNNFGLLYSNLHDYTNSEKYFKYALMNNENLFQQNPNAYRADLAKTQNNLGNLYVDLHDYVNSEKYFKSALENYEILFSQNPNAYRADLAGTQNNFGFLSSNLHDFSNSEKYYKDALENKENLFQQNPDAYREDLARTQNNLGNLYFDLHDYVNSEKYYKSALENYVILFSQNPEAYRENLAGMQNNLGNLYSNLHDLSNSEKYYKDALENKGYLFQQNPEAYRADLAGTQNNLGNLYFDLHEFSNSEKYYKDALENCEILFSQNPEAYREDLAETQNNLGNLYSNLHDFSNSEKYYKDALENKGYLFQQNPEAYRADLAGTQNNLGNLYFDLHDYVNSEKYFKSALENCEILFSQNPEAYSKDLAGMLNNLGNLYFCIHDYTNSKKYYITAMKNQEQLFKKNPDAFRADLATTQNNLGNLYSNLHDYTNSEKYYKLALENREKLYHQYPDAYRADLAGTYWDMMLLYAKLFDLEQYGLYLERTLILYYDLYKSQPTVYGRYIIELQNFKVWRLLENSEVDEAIKLAEATYAMDKSDEQSIENMATCYNFKAYEYTKASEFDNAHTAIDKAISLVPNDPNFYDSKGEIFMMQGKNDEALKMWKKVLELNPDFLKDYPDGTNLSNGLKKLGLIE